MSGADVKLMLVVADNPMGENMDLVVEARDREEAFQMWLAYYEEWDLPEADEVRVFVITPTGSPGILEWDGTNCERIV